MYGRRNEILENESIHNTVIETIKDHVKDQVMGHFFPDNKLDKEDYADIIDYTNSLLRSKIKLADIKDMSAEDMIDFIFNKLLKEYETKIADVPTEISEEFEKVITLNVVDKYWTEHINTMAHLREGIHLRSYAQEDPLRSYTVEGFELFDQMLQNIDREVTLFLVKSEIQQNQERQEVSKTKMTNDGKVRVKQKPKKSKKIGRNDPCPCGSGKKYKQCCGK